MYRLEWVTVKELESVYTVSATAGKHIQIENRSTFGLSFCKSGKITYTHGGKKFVSQIAITSWTPRGKNLGHGWSRRIYP